MKNPVLDPLERYLVPPEQICHRLFHGRGGTQPGLEWLTVDRYPPVLYVTVFRQPPAQILEQLYTLLERKLEALACTALVVQHRYDRNLPLVIRTTTDQAVPAVQTDTASIPAPQTYACEQGLRFKLDFYRGQNIGFFPDMIPARQWLQQRAAGKKVLNLFAFTCAFSVIAKAAGAESVVNIDLSKAALALGQQNHAINNLNTEQVHFLPHNIFRSWKKLHKLGRYDIVIIDPPSDQRGSFVATSDYQKLVRHLYKLLKPQAEILACLNSPLLGEDFLDHTLLENLPGTNKVMRLPAAPGFEDKDQQASLKVIHYQYSRPAEM